MISKKDTDIVPTYFPADMIPGVNNCVNNSLTQRIKWDAGRSYTVSFRIKPEKSEADVHINLQYSDEGKTTISDHIISAGTAKPFEWTTITKIVTIPEEAEVTHGESTLSIYANSLKEEENIDFLIDDISLIPYYKVIYNANGGNDMSVPKAQYFDSGSFSIDTSTLPKKQFSDFRGWSLASDSNTPVTNVTGNKEDITLYAIWESDYNFDDVLKYSFENEKEAGIADGEISISLAPELMQYNRADLYFADKNGRLSEYSRLASVEISEGIGTYSISRRRVIPKGADRICAKLYNNDVSDYSLKTLIPKTKLALNETPLYSFYLISDTHAGGDYWNNAANRAKAFTEISMAKPNHVIINGDLTNNSQTREFETFERFMEQYFSDIPVYITNGNHDIEPHIEGLVADFDALKKLFDIRIEKNTKRFNAEINRKSDNLYYSAIIKGVKYIFLGVPTIDNYFGCGEIQRKWLEENLSESQEMDKPVFVICHFPVRGKVGMKHRLSEKHLADDSEIQDILSRYSNVIYVSGHTHDDLDTDDLYVNVGDFINSPTFIADSCAVWLNTLSKDGKGSEYRPETSMGQYVEAYNDKFIVKGRNFGSGEFISKSLYQIDLP